MENQSETRIWLYGIIKVYVCTKNVALKVWIDVPPKNTDAVVNETVELQCQGRGDPTPTIRWQKNGQDINFANNPRYFQKHTGSLQISTSQKSDSGKYVCVATNSQGSVRANATLRVLSKLNDHVCSLNAVTDQVENRF